MITFVTTVEQAAAAEGEIRAGGTELQERRRQGISAGPLIDLRDVTSLRTHERRGDGGLRLGSGLRIAEIATMPDVREGYPGLAAAAAGLATPQIRAVGTLGGNLLQRNRCWYFRAPETKCLKKGGNRCYAREGDHLYHACFDLGSCVSVHPSTLGMALMAYDAQVEIHGVGPRSMSELLGDGSDPRRDHALPEGAVLTAVNLPPPAAGERSAYFRTISRSRSEWPLVESLVRLVLDGSTIKEAAVAVGGVAPRPLRLPEVEARLVGKTLGDPVLADAASVAAQGASPLPMTGYKADLLPGTVLETLERAAQAEPAVAVAPAAPTATKSDRIPSAAPPQLEDTP